MPLLQPDKLSNPAMQLSGAHRKRSVDDFDASALVREKGASFALATAVRAALELAHAGSHFVSLSLRNDTARKLPVRIIEGKVAEFDTTRDGRARVRIQTSSDAEQLLLIEKIVRVVVDR